MPMNNYRIEWRKNMLLLFRYGRRPQEVDQVVFQTEAGSKLDAKAADRLLNVIRNESNDAWCESRIEAANDLRRMIFEMLPGLDVCQRAQSAEGVSLISALEEIQAKLPALIHARVDSQNSQLTGG